MNPYLFVYGTLKYKAENDMARFLRSQASYLGKARMCGRLLDAGGYPGAIFNERDGAVVEGDVFKMENPESVLAVLDAYEGISAGFKEPFEYRREERPVYLGSAMIECWVYLYNW